MGRDDEKIKRYLFVFISVFITSLSNTDFLKRSKHECGDNNILAT